MQELSQMMRRIHLQTFCGCLSLEYVEVRVINCQGSRDEKDLALELKGVTDYLSSGLKS